METNQLMKEIKTVADLIAHLSQFPPDAVPLKSDMSSTGYNEFKVGNKMLPVLVNPDVRSDCSFIDAMRNVTYSDSDGVFMAVVL